MLAVGVVGTNGKTSTATYLSRLLTAGGVRTGLYVSPHLLDWTERVRLDDVPCDPRDLVEALTAVHEVASACGEDRGELRFFDILTLAAERLLGAAGAAVTVFEAGIGGRLDAVRALEPRVVLLTGVAIDHAEVLGEDLADVLREKLLVAPPGATLLSHPLADDLRSRAERLASDQGWRLAWVPPTRANGGDGDVEAPAYLGSALSLAREGWRAVDDMLQGAPPGGAAADRSEPSRIALWLPGRLERGEFTGVPYLLDVAHNEAAWRALASEVRRGTGRLDGRPLTALVSVSPGKRRDALAEVLESLPAIERAVVTRHTALPAADPETVAGEIRRRTGVDSIAIEEVDAAIALAFDRARVAGGGVVVFGSTYLVADVRRRLEARTAGPRPG